MSVKKEKKIPSGWREVKLGDVCDIVNGSTPSTRIDKYWNGELDWYTPDDLSKKLMFLNGSDRKITEQGLKSIGGRTVPSSSLILSSRAPIGYLSITTKPSSFNQGCKGLVCKNEVQTEFLFYAITSKIDELKRLGSGSTFLEVGKREVGRLILLIPPLPEQQKIADILMSVDQEIETIDKIISKSEELKKGLMQQLFTKGIGHTKFKKTEIGEIPEGWEINRLGFLSSIQYGHTTSAKNSQVGPKFLRITDIQDGEVNWSTVPYCVCKEIEKYSLRKGDILFARTGATTGKSYLFNSNIESVFASYLIRVQANTYVLDPDFLFEFFQSDFYWKQLNAGIEGGAQGGFNSTKLARLTLPIPTLSEQKQIASLLLVANQKIQINKLLKQKLTELKKGLMQDLLSGEVGVK